jgi:hypothetical protein
MRRSVFRLERTQKYQDRDNGSLHSSCSLASQVLLWPGALLTASIMCVAGGRKRCGGCLHSQCQVPSGTHVLHSDRFEWISDAPRITLRQGIVWESSFV